MLIENQSHKTAAHKIYSKTAVSYQEKSGFDDTTSFYCFNDIKEDIKGRVSCRNKKKIFM